jgi:hypothetical protein
MWQTAGVGARAVTEFVLLARARIGRRRPSPTSASWLNAVENFFSKMTRQRIRRGVFRSIVDLQTAINAYLAEHNASPKPFVCTQSAEAILAKLDRLPVTSL